MKTVNLYFKFHFTSLSMGAQPISLGIISDCEESFYAEFTDYDINRCDDWVKENVISKLKCPTPLKATLAEYGGEAAIENFCFISSISRVRESLEVWLEEFKDCNIQFIMDCSQLGWLWMVEFLDKRFDGGMWLIPQEAIPDGVTAAEFLEECKKAGPIIYNSSEIEPVRITPTKFGLPILEKNISPVPEDLNHKIAFERKISVQEAFDLSRRELICRGEGEASKMHYELNQHNALFDAKVIKAIYSKNF